MSRAKDIVRFYHQSRLFLKTRQRGHSRTGFHHLAKSPQGQDGLQPSKSKKSSPYIRLGVVVGKAETSFDEELESGKLGSQTKKSGEILY